MAPAAGTTLPLLSLPTSSRALRLPGVHSPRCSGPQQRNQRGAMSSSPGSIHGLWHTGWLEPMVLLPPVIWGDHIVCNDLNHCSKMVCQDPTHSGATLVTTNRLRSQAPIEGMNFEIVVVNPETITKRKSASCECGEAHSCRYTRMFVKKAKTVCEAVRGQGTLTGTCGGGG